MALCLAASAEMTAGGLEEKKIEDVTKAVYPSVVKVEAKNMMKKVATGAVISKEGDIVTTALISPRDEEITVIGSDGKKHKAEFLGLDTETQLAVIRAKEANLPPIAFGKTADLAPGAWVGVVSISPEGTPAVTQGIVSSISDDWLRLNVWVTPGMSGSPVVDKDGQMIGLLRGVYSDEQPVVFEFREREVVGSGYVYSRAQAPSSGMALAVPIDIISAVAPEIKKKGRVARGWLGVSIADNEAGQVQIVAVDKESPAELAKLKEGDIILKFDGKDAVSSEVVASEIRKRKPGQDITLKIEREGKPMEIKIKLGEYTREEAQRELELRFPQLFPAPAPPFKEVKPDIFASPRIREMIKPFGRTWETRKYIGVYLQETSDELAQFFGLKEGRGLLVTSLTEGSPAEKAGLRVGDVIFRVDGVPVDTVSELSGRLQDKKKGDKVKIEFYRDKKAMSVEVEIAEEESGPGLESFLSSWYSTWDYNDALARMIKESKESSNKRLKEIYEESLKKNLESAKKGIESGKPNLWGTVMKSYRNYFRI
jgi:S1-C subfamily serine protease